MRKCVSKFSLIIGFGIVDRTISVTDETVSLYLNRRNSEVKSMVRENDFLVVFTDRMLLAMFTVSENANCAVWSSDAQKRLCQQQSISSIEHEERTHMFSLNFLQLIVHYCYIQNSDIFFG